MRCAYFMMELAVPVRRTSSAIPVPGPAPGPTPGPIPGPPAGDFNVTTVYAESA